MKKSILIFDDDQETLTVCKIIFEQKNYRVETRAYCDNNIIDDINLVKPDIILIDLQMPRIGGEKAIDIMKTNKAVRNIPVILFSANLDIEKISNRANTNGFLKKPFEISSLLDIVRNNI